MCVSGSKKGFRGSLCVCEYLNGYIGEYLNGYNRI